MQIDLHQFLDILKRRRRPAAFTFVLVSLIVVFLGLTSTPRYDASTLLLVGESLSDRTAAASGTAARQVEDSAVSLAVIATTEDVLSGAAQQVGWERLFPGSQERGLTDFSSLVRKIRTLMGRAEPDASRPADGKAERIDLSLSTGRERTAQISALQRAVLVRPEAKAGLIQIVFGHRDPIVAAQFTNALARSLISRQSELWSRPGAVDFFQIQRQRFEDDVRSTSADFAAFIASNAAYSVDDQRELLLKRASEVGAALAATRGSIAERMGQKQALTDQLKRLKPVTASPFVSNLVDALGTQDRDALGPQPKEDRSVSNDPPLLLVKVYQDGLVQLLKVNSELAGFNNLASQQERELTQIDEQLGQLASKEAQFNKLKKAVEIASSNAETYSKRMIDEQISADLAKAKMAGLRLVQAAVAPIKPAFPTLQLLLAGAVIAGLLAAILMAAILEVRSPTTPLPKKSPIPAPADDRDDTAAPAPADETLRVYRRF